MRLPLVITLDAGSAERGPHPATDENGKVVLAPAEKEDPFSIRADKLECSDFLPGKSEVVFWMNLPERGAWEVILTNRRLIFQTPYSKGMIGTAKIRKGKAAAGHMPLSAISHISTFYSKENVPILLVCCYRQDGTRSAVVIHSAELEAMRTLLVHLQNRIRKYLIDSGNFITTEDIEQEKIDEIVRKWSELPVNAWKDPSGECQVIVPNRAWTRVP